MVAERSYSRSLHRSQAFPRERGRLQYRGQAILDDRIREQGDARQENRSVGCYRGSEVLGKGGCD